MKTFRCIFCLGNFIVRQAQEEIEDHKDRLKLHNGKRPKSDVRDFKIDPRHKLPKRLPLDKWNKTQRIEDLLKKYNATKKAKKNGKGTKKCRQSKSISLTYTKTPKIDNSRLTPQQLSEQRYNKSHAKRKREEKDKVRALILVHCSV